MNKLVIKVNGKFVLQPDLFNYCSEGNLEALRESFSNLSTTAIQNLVSLQFHNGQSCLIAASRFGHLNIVKYLIDNYNADVERAGTVSFDGDSLEGVPPLWCAAAAGHLQVASFLVMRGANVNHTTITNSTALRAASFDGHENIVKYLVEHGANIELQNRHGHTCLMISCYRNHYNIAKYLIEKGARVNRQSSRGNTALHDCAEAGNLEALKLLLENGAIMKKDEYNLSPIMSAANSGCSQIVDYLCNLKMDPESKTFTVDDPEREKDWTSKIPLDDKVYALELLGATHFDKNHNIEEATAMWKKAMYLRFNFSGIFKKLPVNYTDQDQTFCYAWELIKEPAQQMIVIHEEEKSNKENIDKKYCDNEALTYCFTDFSDSYYETKSKAITEMLRNQYSKLNLRNIADACVVDSENNQNEKKNDDSNCFTKVQFRPSSGGISRTNEVSRSRKRQIEQALEANIALKRRTKADAILGITPSIYQSYRNHKSLEFSHTNTIPSGTCGKFRNPQKFSYEQKLLHKLEKICLKAMSNCREFVSPQELDEMHSDLEKLKLQSLLIRLRILGPDHSDAVYFLRFRGALYADSGYVKKCFDLWRFALLLQRIFLDPLCHVSQSTSLSFAELFSYILTDSYSGMPTSALTPEYLIECLQLSIDNIERGFDYSYYNWFYRNPWSYSTADKEALNLKRHTCLSLQFIAMILHYYIPNPKLFKTIETIAKERQQEMYHYKELFSKGIPSRHLNDLQERRKMLTPEVEYSFYQQVYRLVKLNPIVHNGQTLIHLACSYETTRIGRYVIFEFPSPETIMLLCQLGADPNQCDAHSMRPIGMILNLDKSLTEKVTLIKTLVDCNAEIDASNLDESVQSEIDSGIMSNESEHFCLMDEKYSSIRKSFQLKPSFPLSLKCLTARVIKTISRKNTFIANELPRVLPSNIIEFIEKH